MPIWEFLKYLREKAGLTQKDFGDKIGCSVNHVSRIERPFTESRSTASIELLRKIAEQFSTTTDERIKLERQLLLKVSRMHVPSEIADLFLGNAQLERGFMGMEGGMPRPFTDRLRRDLEADAEKADGLSSLLPAEAVMEVLKGLRSLSASRISIIAKYLGQPVDEYLQLSGYMTESVRRVVESGAIDSLLENITRLNPQQVTSIKTVLNTLVGGMVPGPKKEKRGRPRKTDKQDDR